MLRSLCVSHAHPPRAQVPEQSSSCQSLCKYLLVPYNSQILSSDPSPPRDTPAVQVPSCSLSGPLPCTHRDTETWPTSSFFLSAFKSVLNRHLLSSGLVFWYCSPSSSSSSSFYIPSRGPSWRAPFGGRWAGGVQVPGAHPPPVWMGLSPLRFPGKPSDVCRVFSDARAWTSGVL